MKVSLNWIKKFADIDVPAQQLVEKIGAQLGAVDEVKDMSEKYKGIIVAKVVSCIKHPNADKLSVCMIDDGGKAKQVQRDSKGLVQVVCGAPNVAAGQMVVWLPPGATVPSTYEKDPFVLESRELRGEMSNGMIASAKELDLGDDHTGIMVLDAELKPGDDFARALELDDIIIDIENKMFTHRPDLFGMLGIAREIAGISGKKFASPKWYDEHASLNNDGRKNVLGLSVKNDLPKLVPRFTAIAIKDVRVGDSPAWLKSYLARVGVRPINNIVDITNYLMLETAQPLHAYDYDKLQTGTLGVRLSREGEQVTVIGNKNIKLKASAIVITDGQKPIGLGGVMGGLGTEVDHGTKNIVLEVANFDMNTTRRTAMAYGLFTDAATRFTKNQSPHQTLPVLVRAVSEVRRLAGGRVASKIVDDKHVRSSAQKVSTSVEFVNARLGLNLSGQEMKRILENVEFKVAADSGSLEVKVPFWRTDIEIEEDIVEEIGRLLGYDHLPLVLPGRSIEPVDPNEELSFKAKIRDILAVGGANEMLTYSFVHGSLLKKVGQDSLDAHQIRNALSPDLQYYRVSLAPSLIEKVHANIKAGHDEFAIFEMNKVHVKKVEDKEKLPSELERLALVYASKDPRPGAPFYAAKSYAQHLLINRLGIPFELKPLGEVKLSKQWDIAAKPFEPVRTAAIMASGEFIGLVGEPTADVKQNLKLPAYSSLVELDLDLLRRHAGSLKIYYPLNRYPETNQDICLRLESTTSYRAAEEFILDQLEKASRQHGYKHWLKPLDIFQRKEDKGHKQITWRITLAHPERTLTTEEVNAMFDMISVEAKKELKAERV